MKLAFVPYLMPGGGGIYVNNGSLHQMGGSIKMNTSNSEEFGGGLLINNGSLVQAAGQISCHTCSAKRGGCLALNGVNYSLQTNGSIEAEDCTADAGMDSKPILNTVGGSSLCVLRRWCTAHRCGEFDFIWPDHFQPLPCSGRTRCGQ